MEAQRVPFLIVEAVTPISVETGIIMVSPMAIGTAAPTVGAYSCVDCACHKDCDYCHDAEVPLIVGLVIVFKDLPLLKCIHKQDIFLKNLNKKITNFQKTQVSQKRF